MTIDRLGAAAGDVVSEGDPPALLGLTGRSIVLLPEGTWEGLPV